jgi:hypothetical protein
VEEIARLRGGIVMLSRGRILASVVCATRKNAPTGGGQQLYGLLTNGRVTDCPKLFPCPGGVRDIKNMHEHGEAETA